ncbi:acetyl-CoA C-acyltransferase [Sporolactobacillus spathodeae]|uniref:acetyl-CoA C-acetyltransferase n=1 Tax=Sporolactobacillus spathodeae TaxID=1465502 RepID=A0ABS2QAX6_9BACL|nr:acetyl-CoA C-acetyltransferase [Sporolactobacillus spathodeae]
MNRSVYIVSARRTAVGKVGGSLKNFTADELLLPLVRDIVENESFDPNALDEIIIGQAKQSQDQSNLARYAALKAGLPERLPGYTVHRQCGSGMQAIHNAYLAICSGLHEAVLAGGAESMSTAPYYLREARYGYRAGNGQILDPNKESQPGSQPEQLYGRLTMGLTAENLAEEYSISRREQDLFALNSQVKAQQAITQGHFKKEIVLLLSPQKKGPPKIFETDEHPRETSLEKLAALPPVFQENGTVTAGNSSGLNDGASLLLVASEDWVKRFGLMPIAKIIGLGVSAVDPRRMGIGPVEAVRRALNFSGLGLQQMDLIELNEAFAAQSLAVIHELDLPGDKVNIHGGAIALGHPIGNSGARICVTLIHAMQERQVEYGLATLCAAGGQGITMIFKTI